MPGSYVPIIPSSLLDMAGEEFDALAKNFSDFSLKIGVIIRTYAIEDEKSISKNYVEYDVMCFSQEKDLGVSSVVYQNCGTAEMFGGLGDFMEFTLRSPKKNPKQSVHPQSENGSTVLLLCLDGNQDRGIIVGSLKHLKRATKLTKDAGHHLEGEFNGLNWQINKDGALTITFNSKTDNDGKPQDEDSGGTHIQIDKSGQVDINANLSGDDETYIRMDKKNKDVGLKAGANIGLTAKENIGLNASGNANINAEGDLIAKAGGSATLESSGAFSIKANGAMEITSKDLSIKSDVGVIIDTQQVMVNATMIQLGTGGTPAITMSTQFMGIGNLGAPVISTAIGPFSSSVFIAS